MSIPLQVPRKKMGLYWGLMSVPYVELWSNTQNINYIFDRNFAHCLKNNQIRIHWHEYITYFDILVKISL